MPILNIDIFLVDNCADVACFLFFRFWGIICHVRVKLACCPYQQSNLIGFNKWPMGLLLLAANWFLEAKPCPKQGREIASQWRKAAQNIVEIRKTVNSHWSTDAFFRSVEIFCPSKTLKTYIFRFSPNSVLLGVLNAFLRCPPWCWMVCPPSRGSCLPLSPPVSPCLPLSPFLLPFVGWCVRLPEDLASPCLPLSPFLFPFVGWCVRLPEGLVSPCLLLSPFLLPFVGWCVRLTEGLASPCLPLSTFLFPFDGWCVRLPGDLVYPCLPL